MIFANDSRDASLPPIETTEQSWRFRDDLCPKNRPQRGGGLGPKFGSAGREADTIPDVVSQSRLDH
jgi:hypothetical protein